MATACLFVRSLVCIQTADCPENIVHEWWTAYGQSQESARGRAQSLHADNSSESLMTIESETENLRPYSSVLADTGEALVADYSIPETWFAQRWGRLVAFKPRLSERVPVDDIWLVVTKHTGSAKPWERKETWTQSAALEVTMNLCRWLGHKKWPKINIAAWGSAATAALELCVILKSISACTELTAHLVAPVGSSWPSLSQIEVNALFHGSDCRATRVPYAKELWLAGTQQRSSCAFCCGNGRRGPDKTHTSAVYARDLWRMMQTVA